jgi:hypothetical protein
LFLLLCQNFAHPGTSGPTAIARSSPTNGPTAHTGGTYSSTAAPAPVPVPEAACGSAAVQIIAVINTTAVMTHAFTCRFLFSPVRTM